MMIHRIKDKNFKEFISAEQIAEAVERVAERINESYAAGEFSTSDTPLIISVLNGSVIFCSDVIRKLNFDFELSFVKLSSYVGTQSSGCVKELIGLNEQIEGRDVIVVEDIIETGCCMDYIIEKLHSLGANSVKTCTLTFKPNRYKSSRAIDYVGFEIEDEFIVGYGMDYMHCGRGLSEILVVADE